MDDPVDKTSEDSLSAVTVSFGISLAITSVVSALLVVAKEKSPAVMAAMKSATGHHWATHSLFALALFLAIGFGLARMNGGKGIRMTSGGLVTTVVCGIAIGSIIIGGFYLIAD